MSRVKESFDYYQDKIAKANGCPAYQIKVTEASRFLDILSVNYDQIMKNGRVKHCSKIFDAQC